MDSSAPPVHDDPRRLVALGDDIAVFDNAADNHFEAWLDGEVAGVIEYLPHDGWLVLVHTEVPEAFEGRGVASRLARAALDDLRSRGLVVSPQCPFVLSYVKRHPEYRPLVVGVRGPRPLGSAPRS
jgi:predicted GNAT family acetyltransferase